MRDLAIDNIIIKFIYYLRKKIIIQPEDGSNKDSRNV